MSESIAFDKTVELIKDRLSLNSFQQKLISSNLANINTPGYSAKETSFKSVLEESMESTLPMTKTSAEHMDSCDVLSALKSPKVEESGRVDLDWEMMKLSQNSVEYQYMVNLIGKKFAGLRNAIEEGGK
ncbi:MAG: flagellar basal body rod protein FlgB [Syntrophobacteraceae bacterium]